MKKYTIFGWKNLNLLGLSYQFVGFSLILHFLMAVILISRAYFLMSYLALENIHSLFFIMLNLENPILHVLIWTSLGLMDFDS